MRHFYDHGLPFSERLASPNLDKLKLRVERKKASLIIIDGGVGEGKTTLAIEIGDYFEGAPIEISKQGCQYAMGGADFLKKLRKCYEQRKKVIVYDESGDFNKRGSLTRFNAMLNRTFETFRGFNIIVILVLPFFGVLDNDLFDKNIPRLLIHTHGRTMTSGSFSAFSLYRMLWVKKRMEKLVVKAHAYGLVQPNFRGHFLDLEPERSKALDRLSVGGKIHILEAAEVKIEGLVSYREIAQKLVRSVVWVRKNLKDLKIKESRTIKQRKYFDGGVVDILANRIDQISDKRDKGERRK